ncbi:MAG TPA: diadenosine tetraphosphate hydrolase, partial [Nitrososphaera sp.]
YRYRRGRRLVQKEVALFLGQTNTRQIVLSHEHIGFAWKNYESAMEQLTYQNAKNLLTAARQHLQRMTSQ